MLPSSLGLDVTAAKKASYRYREKTTNHSVRDSSDLKGGSSMKTLRCLVLIAGLCSVQLPPLFGQSSPAAAQPVTTASQAVLQAWNEVGRKLVAMAEDFPEAKYDFKPTPEQKTFAEQLMHAAKANNYFLQALQGREPKYDESSETKGKVAVVAYVKKSFADGAAVIQAKGDQGMAQTTPDPETGIRMPLTALAYEAVEHSGEHYGQLVVYYRVAGLVPPESRPKK